MGRSPCCDKSKVKRGTWSPEEDATLKNYLQEHGTAGNWIALPHKAGLQRCGKSCRLRWLNYLRPDIKHGAFTQEEDDIICNLYKTIGSRWSVIASHLPGRTDNDVKNYWNTKLKKKFTSTQFNTGASLVTATSDTAAAASGTITTTGIFDDKTIFQSSPTNNSLIFPPTFLIPSLQANRATGLVNSNFQSEQKMLAFPRFILEESGVSSGSKSCPVPQSHQDSSPSEPLSLGMVENYGVNEIPMHEVGLSGIWSQEDGAIGADNNADLFSIFSYPKAQGVSQSNY